MRILRISVLVVLAGCALDQSCLAEPLIDSRCNITRQRAYIADTQARLASCVLTNRPTFAEVRTDVAGGITNHSLHGKDTWIPIGTNGWFYFVCHSSHSEWSFPYRDVGDLSIGIDDAGEYYFCRRHVCGALSFRLPTSGRYDSMVALKEYNRDWHNLPSNWTNLVPAAPAVDITSHIIGTWRGIDGKSTAAGIDLEFRDRGWVNYSIRADVDSCSGSGHYDLLSQSSLVLTNSDISGVLSLSGVDLTGTVECVVEDLDEEERLMELRQTNIIDVIYSHTNRYTGSWKKVVGTEYPTR